MMSPNFSNSLRTMSSSTSKLRFATKTVSLGGLRWSPNLEARSFPAGRSGRGVEKSTFKTRPSSSLPCMASIADLAEAALLYSRYPKLNQNQLRTTDSKDDGNSIPLGTAGFTIDHDGTTGEFSEGLELAAQPVVIDVP